MKEDPTFWVLRTTCSKWGDTGSQVCETRDDCLTLWEQLKIKYFTLEYEIIPLYEGTPEPLPINDHK